MASAGRILIMPKGDYNADTEYERLDLVYHNGTSWIAKKTSKGIEPSNANSEYWQMMFGFDGMAKANGGTTQFTANPNGNDYVEHTFNLPGTSRFYINTVGGDSLYVVGVIITGTSTNDVTVRVMLNKPTNEDVEFVVGYIY